MREGLGGQALPRRVGDGACAQLTEHTAVVRGIDQDGHAFMILGRGPQHRRPADVDILDCISVAATRPRNRRGERVEIDDQQVDRADAVLVHDGIIESAASEQRAVHFRVQGLDAPVHDFRKAGLGGDLGDRKSGGRQ